MPAGGVSDKQLVIGAAVLTIVLVAAGAFVAPAGGGAAAPSSFSAAADGGKAAFETLTALGYRVSRSYEPLASLRADPSATGLFITGSLEPSEQDRRALLAFVEAGGEVLLVGAQGARFLEVDGALHPTTFTRAPAVHRALAPSPLTSRVPEMTMLGDAGQPKFGPQYVVLFAVDADRPLVATARIGKGRVVWWASPTPLANTHISRASNLQLLLNVAGAPGARQLLWDEHYHGHSRTLWSYLAQTPLPWVAAQAGLIALAAMAAYSRRRGPVRTRGSDTRSSPLEFIEMLGALYSRSGARGAAITAARARFDRAVVSATGVPHDSPDETVAAAIAIRTGVEAGDVVRLLADARRTGSDPDVTAQAAVDVIGRLQRLTESVNRAGARSHAALGVTAN